MSYNSIYDTAFLTCISRNPITPNGALCTLSPENCSKPRAASASTSPFLGSLESVPQTVSPSSSIPSTKSTERSTNSCKRLLLGRSRRYPPTGSTASSCTNPNWTTATLKRLTGCSAFSLRAFAVKLYVYHFYYCLTRPNTNTHLGYGDLPSRKCLRAYPLSLPIA